VGNVVTKYPVKKVELKEAGISTLGARKIWYDETIRRLNDEGRGVFMGEFYAEDKLLIVLDSGDYKLISPELSTHFDENMVLLEKWIPEKPMSAVYFDGDKGQWFVKRFLIEDSKGTVKFITEHEKSRLGIATTLHFPTAYIRYDKRSKLTRNKMDEGVGLRDFISVKGLKALGNRLTNLPVLSVELLEADADLEARENEKIAAKNQRRSAEPAQLNLLDAAEDEHNEESGELF
jgi:topoisomerase-4 subunit A